MPARGDADAPDQPGAELGRDVAVEVGQHEHVEPLRRLDQLHAQRVDDAVLERDVGVVLRATRRATSRNSPSENFMMLALWLAVTLRAAPRAALPRTRTARSARCRTR